GIPPEKIEALLDGQYDGDGKGSTGLGVRNANKRLQYYFGPTYGVQFNRERPVGTEVVLKIPLRALPRRVKEGFNV
ncbi:MAG: histidine kinase, partial [Eubacteriaceae bacterium]|nr:histidine kinase [Eubacteriaceae bacterium]